MRSNLSTVLASSLAILLAGCSSRSVPMAPQSLHLTGNVHGGQQPVSGATIQLYDITGAVQGSATPLLTSPVTTDAGGGFTLTGLYSCPAATDQVYLAATGGDPGAGANDNLILFTAMGQCGDLTAATMVTVNEVSSVAMLFAFSTHFNPAPAVLGANISGADSNAYGNFQSLVDPVSGMALATNGSDTQLKLNALADSMATCVNASSTHGDTPSCDMLVSVAGPQPPANTVANSAIGIWMVSQTPTWDVTDVYNLAGPAAPFQPTPASAPADWNLAMPY